MADGTGKEKDHIFKVELPNESGTSYPRALRPKAEIKAWNTSWEKPQMSSFQKLYVIKVSDVWRHAAGCFYVCFHQLTITKEMFYSMFKCHHWWSEMLKLSVTSSDSCLL